MKEKFMIKRLRVKNFLSLRSVEVELGKLTVLIGPNASGKSNLAKVLLLISEHVRGKVHSSPSIESTETLPTISTLR